MFINYTKHNGGDNLSFDICFDKECSSLMIRNIDELWEYINPQTGIFKN